MSQTKNPQPAFETASSLPDLYEMLDQVQMKNGWAKPTPSLYPEPKRRFVPAHWQYRDARAALHKAGDLVDPRWAERRNLIMANPVLGNDYPTVTSIVGAYQMVKAGETARSHRHTPNAMRVVLEAAPHTYTVVEGVKVPMEPGDVLLTPNWCYHGHNNESDQDAYWIDFLDAPLVQLLDPMFFEHSEEPPERAREVDAASPMRFAYTEYRPKLMAQGASHLGIRQLHLGPPELVTFDRTALHLTAGARWSRPRTTISRIYTVVEGSGTCEFAGSEVRWSRGDMIAIPNWHEHTLVSDSDAVLLQVSDLPLLTMLGWVREQPHTERNSQ